MSKEKKDVAKVETTKAIATTEADSADWGHGNVGNNEMLMPRLALMHGTSALVTSDKALAGEIVNTATEKVLAKKGESLEIIPIKMLPKTWVISKEGKWLRTEIAKPTDEDREWEQGEEKHERCLNFYVLVRKDIESGEALPHLLSFKGTAVKTGRKLVNHFKMSASLQKAPARTVFKLGTQKRSNDANTWTIWALDELGTATEQEVSYAFSWLKSLKSLDDALVTRYEQEAEGAEEGADPQTPPTKKGEVNAGARY